MAEEEEDREITLRWADRAALGSARTGLMRRVGGSAEEGGDDPSFFCSKPNAALSKQQQINKKPTPKNHPFFLRSHPAAAAAPWWGSAQITSRQLLPGVSGSPGHPAAGQDPACSRPPAPPSHRDLTLPFEIIVVFAKKKTRFQAGVFQERLSRCVSADAFPGCEGSCRITVLPWNVFLVKRPCVTPKSLGGKKEENKKEGEKTFKTIGQ